ncbi:GTPase HflX [Trichinella spiralis]|uniref:GTPase HflX n=1 Tax=Trichinella spiralis TaxID=6334 RepID=A0ABR3KCV7_TRISP
MSADKELLDGHHSSKRKVSKRTALRSVLDYANYLQILYSYAEYKNTLNQVTSIVKNREKQNEILEEKLVKQYNEIRSLYVMLKCVREKMIDTQNENKLLSQLHKSVEAAIGRIKLITNFPDETSVKMLNVNTISLENIAISLKPLFESEDKISALEKSVDGNLHCLTSLADENAELSTLKKSVIVTEEHITEQKFNSIIQYLKRSFP